MNFEGKIFSLKRDKTAFSHKAEDGTQTWFNLNRGQTLDDSYRGAEVQFEYVENGRWKNVDATAITITKAAEPYTGGGNKGGYSKPSGGSKFDGDGMARGNAIHAASRVVAASIVSGKLEPSQAVAAIAKLTQAILDATNGAKPAAPKQEEAPAPQGTDRQPGRFPQTPAPF